MTITKVVVCCREDALHELALLESKHHKVVWVHVMNPKQPSLFPRTTKSRLIVKFLDVQVTPSFRDTPDLFSRKQAQKIRSFLCNWHINKPEEVVVLVNCNAGQSRSTAIGQWCGGRFGVDVEYKEPLDTIHPNTRVLYLLWA